MRVFAKSIWPKKTGCRHLYLILGSAVAYMSLAATAHAQIQRFDVPSAPLADVLNMIADQSHTQLLVSSERIRGHVSRGLHGQLSPLAALNEVLADSNLVAQRVGENAFIIVEKPRSRDSSLRRAPAVTSWTTEIVVVGRRPALTSLKPSPPPVLATDDVSMADQDTIRAWRGGNAIDVLSRMSGVNILKTGQSFIGGIDGAARGESMYVAARGLNAEYSLHLFDGMPIAQGMPYSRALQIGVLPADNLQAVAMYRSNSADMAGDVIGVTIDWQTPDPFSYVTRGLVRYTASGSFESRANDYRRSGTGSGGNLEVAGRLGSTGKVAAYFSIFADQRSFANAETGGIMAAQNDGAWAFSPAATSAGTAPLGDPQRDLVLTGLNFGVSEGTTKRSGGVLNVGFQIREGLTADVRMNLVRAQTDQASTLEQITPQAVSWTKAGNGGYQASVDSVSTRVWYETNPERVQLANVKGTLRFAKDRFEIAPYVFASRSEFSRPNHLEASARDDETDGINKGNLPRTLGGPAIVYDTDGYPVPVLTPDIAADLSAAATRLIARRAGQLTVQTSYQARVGGGVDARWRPTSLPGDVEWGVRVMRSRIESRYRDWRNDYFGVLTGKAGVTWSDLGLATGTYPAVTPGRFPWSLPRVDGSRLEQYFQTYRTDSSFDTCGIIVQNNENCGTHRGDETVGAVYTALHLTSGAWQITPGWRQEWSGIRSSSWILPSENGVEQLGHWQEGRTDYVEALPSLLIAWHPAEDRTYSAALWRSYMRPAFSQLAGDTTRSTSGGVTTIQGGNPNLKPVSAINADLTFRWQGGGHQIRLGVFGKYLRDYLYDSGAGLANPTLRQDAGTRYLTSLNGGKATVLGIETEGHFVLSPRWDVSFAVTRQWTRGDLGTADLGPWKPLQNAPGLLATFELGYKAKASELGLRYRYSSAYLAEYDALSLHQAWDDKWIRPSAALDLNGSVAMSAHLKLQASVTNLTGSKTYWAHIGKNNLAVSDIVDAGQTFRVSAAYMF